MSLIGEKFTPMRRNISLLTFVVGALVLAACGGGVGSSGAPPVPVPIGPQPTATPSGPTHPSGAGDVFIFTGTATQKSTYTYPVSSPLPSSSTSATITQNVAVIATPNPFGSGTVQDFNVKELDAYPQVSHLSTTDYYYQSGTTFSLLGYSSKDDAGDKNVLAYSMPQVLDQLPEVSGASWTNNPASVLTQSFVDGQSATHTIAANGTYADTEQIYGTGTNYPSVKANITENPDGSGQLQIVRYENGRTGFQPNETVYNTYDVSAPSAQSPGVQFIYATYQVNDTYLGAPSPPPFSPLAAMPIWYSLPLSLYAENDTDLGLKTIPSSCAVPSAFGSSANEIQQVVNSTDTILGTTTATTMSAYIVNGFGPVCVIVASTVNTYYDYSMDSTAGLIYYQGTTALQTTAFAQTLTLASQASLPQAQLRSTAPSSTALAPISLGEIAIARMRIMRELQIDRAKRIRLITAHIVRALEAKGQR